jgi:hypothetical protein
VTTYCGNQREQHDADRPRRRDRTYSSCGIAGGSIRNTMPPSAPNPTQNVSPANAMTPAISLVERPHAEYRRSRTAPPETRGTPSVWLNA